MDTAHHEPNYMNIFWALTILTIVEVLVPVLGVFSRPVNGTILVLLAVAKACWLPCTSCTSGLSAPRWASSPSRR